MKLDRPIDTVLKKCMGLKKDDSCLIVCDAPKRELGLKFFDRAQKHSSKACYLEVPRIERNGSEPPDEVAKIWKTYDVVVMTTSKSFSHTKARKEASRAGVRIATMPGLTESMAGRTLDIDYNVLKKRSIALRKLLDRGKTAKMTTALGTDVTLSIRKHKAFDDYGLYDTKGRFGNLPAGESGLAPDEGTTNGVIVVDASMGTGRLKSHVKITIKHGFATRFEGKEAAKVKKQFLGLGKNAYNVAEFAIGLNPEAKITGIVLEDEKVLGTAHMALGNNISFGGKVKVPVHIDGVMRKPTIWIDDKLIMKDGKLRTL